MEKLTMTLVAPLKTKGIKDELENLKSFQEKQIFIEISNCFYDLKLFNSYAETFSDVNDVILIFESITEERVNTEKAQSELLESIREIKCKNYEAKIIVVLQTEKEKDLSFVNELMKLDVQNFYFANTFSLDDLAEWIFGKPKILKDNLKYVNAEIKTPQKEIITKEVLKYIEVPIASETLQSQKPIQDKKSRILRNIDTRTYVVGVIGMSGGTGATSICITLANYLKNKKKRVLILDRTENKHLSSIEINNQDIRSDTLSNVEMKSYDYIIIDFGTLVCWNAENFNLKDDMTNEKKLERNFCDQIILVGSSLPWKLRETITYLEEPVFFQLTKEWLFYFTGEDNKPFDKLRKGLTKERRVMVSFEEEEPMDELNKYIINEG